MTSSVALVREVDACRQDATIDIFKWSGSSLIPAGWKVRVTAYDGKSPMPVVSDLLAGGATAKATQPLFLETVAKYRADGWAEELSPAARARIDARVAAEEAAERARQEDLARRLTAFPTSKKDHALAAAIAKPERVRELDLGGDGSDRVTVIPKTVKALGALEILRLDDAGLPELPEELFACKELRELHLAGNAIEDLPTRIWTLKHLAVLDVRNNRLRSIYARPKSTMRLDVSGNPLEPAVQDLLTRSAIGDLRKLTHIGVDTDCVFPIDLEYLEVDYHGKPLATASIVLHGRAPTEAERATLAKLLPKARVEHVASSDE